MRGIEGTYGGVPDSREYRAVGDDVGRDCGGILFPDLHGHKCGNQNNKENKKCNYAAVGPRVCRPAPLEGEEQANDAREEE